MKGICITGANPLDLQQVLASLAQSGVKQAKPAKRDEPIDINFWHEQVISASAEEFDAPQAISNPGRLWEQLASDIVVANLKSKVWAWANTNSIWLLDYWLGFDPRLYFVLVVSSPQHMLAMAMQSESEEAIDIAALMDNWHLYHQELLRFYHRNPKRCLLLDAQEGVENSSAFIESCNTQWKMSLLTPEVGSAAININDAQQSALALHLAQQLCAAYPETASLQREIDATRLRLSLAKDDEEVSLSAALSPDQIVQDYRALRDRSAEREQLQISQLKLAKIELQLETAAAECEQKLNDLESRIRQISLDRDQALSDANAAQESSTQLANQLQKQLERMHSDAAAQAQELSAARTEQEASAQFAQQTQQQLEQVQNRITEATQESELLLLQLHQVQEELEVCFHEREAAQNQLSQVSQEKVDLDNKLQAADQAHAAQAQQTQEQVEQAQNRVTEATQESELLLLQLHQVQEELEVCFLGREATQNQLSQVSQEKVDIATKLQSADQAYAAQAQELSAARAAQETSAQLANQRQEQLEQLQNQLEQVQSAAAAEAANAQAQIQQLMSVQGQLSDTVNSKSQLKQQLQQLQAELANSLRQLEAAQQQANQVMHERDAQVALNGSVIQEKADLESRLQNTSNELAAARTAIEANAQSHSQQLQATQGRLEETKQESELLLLQLHQVQEELEHYFLQHQEVLKSKEEADSRWQRMQHRMPDYCDFDAIEMVTAEANTAAWRIKGLNAVGRSWPQLEFKTTLENDTAGYLLARQTEGASLLAHWPVCAAEQPELLLIPVGTPQNGPERLEALLELSTSDWTLLQTITKLLLTQADFTASPATATGLQKLSNVLGQFPATLRFDKVSLKREQVNPDYEHLWLCLHNLSFGGKRWPEFEFRVSCAGVRPKTFGRNPKLEFPEHTGQQPFAAWFDESFDDFGAKLELRFALPEAMDMGLWQRLPPTDQAFILALTGRLPAILKTLQIAGQKLKRNWDDWLTMVGEMQRVIALRTAPVIARAVPTPPVVQAAAATPAVQAAPAVVAPAPRKTRKAK